MISFIYLVRNFPHQLQQLYQHQQQQQVQQHLQQIQTFSIHKYIKNLQKDLCLIEINAT